MISDETTLEQTLQIILTPGVGPTLYRALIERFGDEQCVLKAPAAELASTPGVGPKLADAIRRSAASDEAAELIRRQEQDGIAIIRYCDSDYPSLLREIADPPVVLFTRGTLLEEDQLAIAIVGSRNATPYGRRIAARLARELSGMGFTVVSGLARGVDGAAHRGAIDAGGRTIGVLGGGVLNVYPPEHEMLAEQVASVGALLSEFPPFAAPKSGSFPRRNRIVSGMSLGVVVVEASHRSGALISARLAGEQGREVFAVPGRIDTANSRGCHRLLKDGAKLVETIDDVLEELGPLAHPTPMPNTAREVRHPVELKLNDVERAVLDKTSDRPTLIDDVIDQTELKPAQVLATVSALEMRRLIRRVGGCQIVREHC